MKQLLFPGFLGKKTELKGLDVTEHGQDAYASFQFFSNM